MRHLSAFLAALVLGCLVTGTALAQASPQAAKQCIVIQVSTPETRIWSQALNYVENLQSLYGKDNVEIEIVALGWGIDMLKFDSPLATRVADTLKRGAANRQMMLTLKRGAGLSACEVTMSRQKLQKQDMLPDIGYVPAGLGQIIKRQRDGWSYISG